MMHDGFQESSVHLSLVVTAQEEEDGLADAGDGALVASDAREPVDQPVAGQKLAQSHGHEKPLKVSSRLLLFQIAVKVQFSCGYNRKTIVLCALKCVDNCLKSFLYRKCLVREPIHASMP